jgi:excisionase family DNA binding protein
MAYSLKEFATMMGLSYATAYRLVQRGKVRSVGHIRHKLIPASEVARFLA